MADDQVTPIAKKSQGINLLADALAKAQADIKTPKKTQSVKMSFQKKNGDWAEKTYSYADLSAVMDAIRGPLSSQSLAIFHKMGYCKGPFGLTTVLVHKSGQQIDTWYPLPDPKSNSIKAQDFGSALTYGRRYSVSSLVGIASEDDDDGGDAPETEKPGGAKQSNAKKQEPLSKEPPKPLEKHPRDFVMPTGDGVKGKKLAEIPIATLKKILAWTVTETAAQKGNAKALKELLEIATNVKAMIPPEKPPEGKGPAKTDPFPPDDVQKHPQVENESQVRGAKPAVPDVDDFVIPIDVADLDGVKGKALKQLPEATLKKIVLEIEASMKRTPPPENVSQLFDITQNVKSFLKSVGVTV